MEKSLLLPRNCNTHLRPHQSRRSRLRCEPLKRSDSAAAAEELCFGPSALDFDSHLEFDQRVSRQRRNTDGGSYVPGRFTQELSEKIGGPVNNFRSVGKAWNRVDVPDHADDPLDFVEGTKMTPQNRQLRERTRSCGCVCLIEGAVETRRSCNHALGTGGNDASQENKISDCLCGKI